MGCLSDSHCAQKYHYSSLSEPTLTLPNLTTLLENVDWDNVGRRMNIPMVKRDMIRQNASGDDEFQCRQKCWELYLLEHPLPSWQQVAHALYRMDCLEELEVVQKKYLKGG